MRSLSQKLAEAAETQGKALELARNDDEKKMLQQAYDEIVSEKDGTAAPQASNGAGKSSSSVKE